MICPTCHQEQPAGNRFCEDCGARLDRAISAAVCPHCGGAAGVDGYCSHCGLEGKSLIENHLELAASASLAGVSDVGKARSRNEDFLAVAETDGVQVLVVCDGVSQSQQADRAAFAAANCMQDGLLKAEMIDAFKAADAAVRAIPYAPSHPDEPAETTVVAAVRRGNKLTLGWLGDSRAYWIQEGRRVPAPDARAGDGATQRIRQLTTDHSWVNQMVDSGELSLEQAMHHPNAHGITKTLGGPTGADLDQPSILQLEIGQDIHEPGWLLLCTDGFWDSHASSAQLAQMIIDCIDKAGPHADALLLARQLVARAVTHRGHDNTTVGLMFIEKARTDWESAV
jgi:serine/threonine protein phosphatase PrpC